MPLSLFHPVIADWFRSRFGAPTDVQARSWPIIASGEPVLIAAPTGSGKTLAAFLACLNALFKQALSGELDDRTQVLYVSPLKALSNDIHKNLQLPLNEIREAALGAGLLLPEIRVTVRTGDTPAWDRQQMVRRPPHILITTPESLFLVLTAEKSRRILRDVRTVIVDEIHAVAPNKRGAHLALSLERLETLTHVPPQRIGLSATQRPIETIARFLVGRHGTRQETRSNRIGEDLFSTSLPEGCRIVDVGHRREMDLAVEVPKDELGAVATNAIWGDVYDRVAALVREHRSTLVFVNTRRLAERVAHNLAERLHDLGAHAVAAHHGSLSKQIRLSAEERLKRGQTRVVVATASLELGIDVGTVDLACQIGSPRAIATCLQRIGRSGHWVGAMPKGRLFATTRDELIECAAVVRAMRAGTLDRIQVPPAPLDILAQQLVAAAATQEWSEEELFALCRGAYPYEDLPRESFDAVVRMLGEGIATNRGRGQAYLHHDRINHRIRPRRGARLAALTSGGAIPETANYIVIAEPEGTVVGSVDEDFAVESLAGDIILLGNSSWRIKGVEMGKMRVEDAHGAPPTIPFWRGEAPSRTAELSAEVASIRQKVEVFLQVSAPSQDLPVTCHPSLVTWLQSECGLDRRGAEQATTYLAAGRSALGALPTQDTVIAERFFDEGGGMQLVIHAPFGGRINRAWGLALRKRFCVAFDFELQAAATDEGIVLSLGERHSFPLANVFEFLRPENLRETLIQAVLAAPMFAARWRWNATRALAILRFARGRRVPPQIQRMRAEDLLAAVFPAATACQDNHVGEGGYREVPDHPLVMETLRDCLTEAMDVEELTAIIRRIVDGNIRCLAMDTPAPSPLSHEILNANPYAFLDDAPLEERRARAVEMRRSLPADLAAGVGALDAQAIADVAEEAWPSVRDPDELHDALLTLIWVPSHISSEWASFLPPLLQTGRATTVRIPGSVRRSTFDVRKEDGVQASDVKLGNPNLEPRTSHLESAASAVEGWVAAERIETARAAFSTMALNPEPAKTDDQPLPTREEAFLAIVRGWMESTGPTTAAELADRLGLPGADVQAALLRLESEGQVLRGQFRPKEYCELRNANCEKPEHIPGQFEIRNPKSEMQEWCDRRLLARIHRRTIGALRKEIEPVTAAEFMRFLFQWQHLSPGTRLHGEAGVLEVVRQLAGVEASASAWERHVLPLRIGKYQPEFLDRLCLGGALMWGRLTPPSSPRRIMPSSVAPIGLFPRDDAGWLLEAFGASALDARGEEALSAPAQDILGNLRRYGASFFGDLVKGTGRLASEVEDGLWELVTAGIVTADGFDNLRALLDPHRRRAEGRERSRRPRHATGRWSPLRPLSPAGRGELNPTLSPGRRGEGEGVIQGVARQLLRRYGVVFRDLLGRESLQLAWRDLLVQFRRMELRGEIRGGRFVSGFTGDQFGLPEAVESLRLARRAASSADIKLSAADPLNLVGVILPGPRVPALPTNFIVFRDGVPVRSGQFRDPSAEVTESWEQAASERASS